MFYDRFKQLCDAKGISVTRATEEIGLARTIGTKWKTTGATPRGETVLKIAEYFGVSVADLLEDDNDDATLNMTYEPKNRDADLQRALLGHTVSKETWEKIRTAAMEIASSEENAIGSNSKPTLAEVKEMLQSLNDYFDSQKTS